MGKFYDRDGLKVPNYDQLVAEMRRQIAEANPGDDAAQLKARPEFCMRGRRVPPVRIYG